MENKSGYRNNFLYEYVKEVLESSDLSIPDDKKDLIIQQITNEIDNEMVERLK